MKVKTNVKAGLASYYYYKVRTINMEPLVVTPR